MYIGFALEKVQMVGWSNVDFKISTIDHNTYYYCSMFIIPTTGQNPNWNSPVHIAFFKIPTAKIQLIIIPTTDQNPNRNFPVQIAFFIIPTSHNPYKVKSRTQLKSLRTQLKSLPTQLKSLLTQLKSLRTQLKSLQTQLKSLRVGIMIVGILIVGILKPSQGKEQRHCQKYSLPLKCGCSIIEILIYHPFFFLPLLRFQSV